MTGSNTDVATFNVGGKIFVVAKSTLDKFEDCMLTRLASETWQGPSNEAETGEAAPQRNAIFVDANSDRFGFVLDYMRQGQVFIPSGVSREAVLADLDYFNIVVDQTKIRGAANHNMARFIALEKRTQDDRRESDAILLACWCRYTIASTDGWPLSGEMDLQAGLKEIPLAFDRLDTLDKASSVFTACFAEFGLQVVRLTVFDRPVDIYITVKPLE